MGECAADDDCLGGQYCGGDGSCARGCRLMGDCAEGLACDEASRQCRPAETDAGPLDPDGAVSLDAGDPDAARAPDAAGRDPDMRVGDSAVGADGHAGAFDGGAPDPDGVVADMAPAPDAAPIVACERDADCAEDEACIIVAAPDGPGFVLSCAPALADGRAEAECGSGLTCASRTCIGRSFCFSPCADGADCPSGVCRGFTVGDGEDRTQFLTCERPPDLCDGDGQCDEGRMCLPVPPAEELPNRVRTACVAAPERAGAGEACAQDAECASLECLAPGVCWGPCRPEVAEDCPAGQRCYLDLLHFIFDQGTPLEADDRYWGMNGCLPDEGSDQACPDGRCPAGEACRLYGNQSFDGIETRCRDAVGNLAGGALCVSDDRCQSGVCLDNGFCLGVCDPRNPLGGQCAAGSVCGQGEFTLWDRGTPANPADDVTDVVPVCVR